LIYSFISGGIHLIFVLNSERRPTLQKTTLNVHEFKNKYEKGVYKVKKMCYNSPTVLLSNNSLYLCFKRQMLFTTFSTILSKWR